MNPADDSMAGNALPKALAFAPLSSSNLGQRALRGGAVAIVAQSLKFVVTFGSMVVFARLLSPRDFGLVGMVTAVTGLLRVFRDGGLSIATVQRPDITREQVSTLFWLNLALGVGLTGVAAMVAPGLAAFYHEPDLVGITIAVASTFLLGSASVQHDALLRRQMRFVPLAVIDVLSTLAGAVCGIVMALRGWGYWSLVGLSIAGAATSVIAKFVMLPWLPGLPRRGCGVRSLVKFGGAITGADVVNYSFRNADNVLIGWFWGAGPLGFYSRAYGLLMLVINQVSAPLSDVAVPTLSRLQADGPRLRRFFLNAYALVASITLPLLVVLVVFADDVVLLVLGPQWQESIRLFRLLAPAAVCGALMDPLAWLFVATGRADRLFRSGVVWTLLMIAAFATGLHAGPAGVASAYSMMSVLLVVPYCAYAVRHTPVSMRDLVAALSAPVTAVALAAIIGLVARFHLLDGTSPFVRLTAGATVTVATYAVVLLIGLKQWARFRPLVGQLLGITRASSEPRGEPQVFEDRNPETAADVQAAGLSVAQPPLLSIGLPVYNGGARLRCSIDSILSQDFADWELIICDNASTDGTAEVCRSYAARDARIRYSRNETNIGSCPNHNRAFELSRGRYFMWTAHDRECLPGMFRRCVEAIEAAPSSVVLVYPRCEMVDELHACRNVDRVFSVDARQHHPHRRLGTVLRRLTWVNQFHGVVSSDALRRTRLFGSAPSPDYVLLAELAMLGELWEIPEVLCRRHLEPDNAFQARGRGAMLQQWLDPRSVTRRTWISDRERLMLAFVRSAWRIPDHTAEKIFCVITATCTYYQRVLLGKIGLWERWLRASSARVSDRA